MTNAKQIREQILAAPDAAPGDEIEWTPEDQAWLYRFMLARDAFHAAAGELVPDWDRDNPNRLRLHLEVLKATGLEPGAFNNLMQMDEIRVVREAAKMKREEREALIAGLLQHGTVAGERRSVAMSLVQFCDVLVMDTRVFKKRAAAEWDLKPDGKQSWTVRLDMMDASAAERVEQHATKLANARRARKKKRAVKSSAK